MPLISVIVPTFNAEKHIDKCLQSLESQSFRNFDVWLMDGGSTDDTVALARGYEGRIGAGVHVLSAKDEGVYDAMNKGISKSSGAWLYFIGADDVLFDSKVFGDLENYFNGGSLDFVYGDVVKKTTGKRHAGPWALDKLLFQGNICHQSIFYRREVFERLGGYNLRYPIWADWDMNIRCFKYPDLKSLWVDRVIAVFNDGMGLSRNGDPVFRKELPVMIKKDVERACSYRKKMGIIFKRARACLKR
ncbi:MAG: glycosyltransferase family 2 protein [Pseudomonadota bacterium]